MYPRKIRLEYSGGENVSFVQNYLNFVVIESIQSQTCEEIKVANILLRNTTNRMAHKN